MPETKEIKKSNFSLVFFLAGIFLFSFALILGIFTGQRINYVAASNGISLPEVSFWQFVFQFFSATLFVFFISFLIKKRKGVVYKFIFILAVWWGGVLALDAWMNPLLALALMSGLVFWWHKQPLVFNHNFCLVLALAGLGAVLGLSFTPEIVILILIFFSVYDFVAVYKTKHMVKMAKEMIEHKAILALIIPRESSGFKQNLEKVKDNFFSQTKEKEFLVLGGGDVVFPLILCVSLLPQGIVSSLFVAGFSLLGLIVNFFILTRVQRPIPALPIIAFFSIIGFFSL